MTDSASEYVLDAPYTWQFFGYQSPLVLNYIARLNGVPTLPLDRPFTYCDLGCGNGVNCNVLAECFPNGEFYGVDFNPEHIANANGLMAQGGCTNVTFLENSFEELLESFLPKFDFIALHGIISWISEGVCEDLYRVVDRFLKPTGLLYVNYNALPGWEPLLPLVAKIKELAADIEGDSIAKMRGVLGPLATLEFNDAPPFKDNPAAKYKLSTMLKDDPNYLVHEYLNSVVRPLKFDTVADDMAAMGLVFCGSAEPADNHIDLSVPAEFRDQFPADEEDRPRESRKSQLLKAGFRRDLYCRAEHRGRGAQSFDDWVFFDTGQWEQEGRGEPTNEDEILGAVIRAGADGSRNIAELCEALKGYPKDTVVDVIHRLFAEKYLNVAAQKVLPVPTLADSTLPGQGLRFTAPLNLAIMQKLFLADGHCDLASRIAGNGRRLQGMQALILVAVHDVGFDAAPALVRQLIDHFKITWHVKGKAVTDPVEREKLLTQTFEAFLSGDLVKWTREGVIEALPPGAPMPAENRISPMLA